MLDNNFANVRVNKCARMQMCKDEMCKDANMQGCKCARMQMCKDANVQVYKCAWMQTCKDANVQGCKHVRMQTCEHLTYGDRPCFFFLLFFYKLAVIDEERLVLLSPCSDVTNSNYQQTDLFSIASIIFRTHSCIFRIKCL